MTTNDNELQRVVRVTSGITSDSNGTENENGTAHFKEWMIAVLSMTKTDTLLLQGMNGCN